MLTKFESMFVMMLLVFGDAAMVVLTGMASKGNHGISDIILVLFISMMAILGIATINRHTEKEPKTKKDHMNELETTVDIQD